MRSSSESSPDQQERNSAPTKVIISVSAGVVPGQAMSEYSRQWSLTAEEASSPESYLAAQGAAVAYTMYLQNPSAVNWVRMDWIWL